MKRLRFKRKKKHDSIESAVINHMNENDQLVYSFLCTPSVREIARALGMPKSTVGDAIKRLQQNGFKTGTWKVGA